MTDRIKRPPLERSEPIRNWSTLLGGAAAGGEGAQLNDVIGRSVDLGYRVIDAYVRQGQRAAERLGGGVAETASVTGDLQELSVRMAQYASELVGLWFQAMDAALMRPGLRSGDGAPPASSPTRDPAPAPPGGEPSGCGSKWPRCDRWRLASTCGRCPTRRRSSSIRCGRSTPTPRRSAPRPCRMTTRRCCGCACACRTITRRASTAAC